MSSKPLLIKDLSAYTVKCGGFHTAAISDRKNQLYTWGRNTEGQCGVKDDAKKTAKP
jgi:alpha-tubulin suppressor-like RCC1 family protein